MKHYFHIQKNNRWEVRVKTNGTIKTICSYKTSKEAYDKVASLKSKLYKEASDDQLMALGCTKERPITKTRIGCYKFYKGWWVPIITAQYFGIKGKVYSC